MQVNNRIFLSSFGMTGNDAQRKRFLSAVGMTGNAAQRNGESVAAKPPRFLPPFHPGAVSFRMKRSGMRNPKERSEPKNTIF